MIKKYTYKSITWADAENPTNEEIRSLIEEYNLDANTARELQLPTYKEKIVPYRNYLYLVMHFPALRHSHKNSNQEIDFIIGRNFIITTRYETIDAIEGFKKTFEVNSILNKGIMVDHAGYVFYYIIKELYKAISEELDCINDTLRLIEKNIFKGKLKEMVMEISQTNRDLLNINYAISSHKEVLESLEKVDKNLFDSNFAENCEKILNDYYRIENITKNSADFLKELRETNDSLLSTKQNETMKILTVITFLAMPFSVITGLFQMNTLHMPLVGLLYDWQIIVVVEITAVIALLILARIKKWL